ncbi:MAG: hypothetical protein FWE05_00390 [Defluviitaleaceae bacterium]|nr:hypothetical protein [Defluviitaleaceae bacterium]
MASAISLEYLKSIEGTPNGLATLDSSGLVPVSLLPPSVISHFKGQFATAASLESAVSTGTMADYAYVTATNSFWYWNAGLTSSDTPSSPGWVNQNITDTAYLALSVTAQAMIPYIIVP